MSDVVIQVERLGKKYRIRHQAERARYRTLRDVLADRTMSVGKRLWSLARNQKAESRKQKAVEDFWALKDVSFEVKQGETLGIIGRNGAGKSTLLKILSRITEPTEGRVRIKGRVASLLEVGTGFHPELTGRENIFLNGAILGMSRAEIKSKFDEIVAFAEVEKFLDTPVKHYSSGMYVRLAFAVAAHLEPEILIVDEVLAVGDSMFQKKCLGRMSEVAAGGRTVLFVSHNLSAIRSLCPAALVLKGGQAEPIAPVSTALAGYLKTVSKSNNGYERAAPLTAEPAIVSACPLTSLGHACHEVEKPLTIALRLAPGQSTRLVVGLHVYDSQLDQVAHSSSEFANGTYVQGQDRVALQITFPARMFNVGDYHCTLVLAERNATVFERLEEALAFTVVDPEFAVANTRATEWSGCCSPKMVQWNWQT
jgi:lipopolysaccharide transport system ATP-binding protein